MKLLLLIGTLALPVSAQTLFVPSGTSGIGSSSNGGIGVGTTNPTGKFHVTGDIRFGVGYGALSEVVSNAATILGNNVIAGAGTNSVKRYFDDPGYGTYLKLNNLGLTFHNVSSQTYATEISYDTGELFKITNTGNVGIGATNPLSKLHVLGVGRFGTMDTSLNNIGGILVASGTGSGGARQYWIGASNPTTHNNNMFQISDYDGSINTPLITIYGAHAGAAVGNVGIGTTTPSNSLTILQKSDAQGADGVRVYRANGSSSGVFLQGSDNNTYLFNYGGGLKFYVNGGVDAVTVTSTGDVGIGTTSPSHKLAVNGTIQAKEVIVQTGWSDYVFAKNYRLEPLSEVEQHIEKEGHLSGIPSAQEVAAHGVSVGEMQSKLLAKVEELTLHQIEQEKQLKQQQRQLRTLTQQNEELLARMKP